MKKALIISYYFPPYASVSVVRVRKYCKYLPGTGWDPTVLSIAPEYYKDNVIGSFEDVESTNVIYLPYKTKFSSILLVKIRFLIFTALHAYKNRGEYAVVYITGPPFFPFLLPAFFKPILKFPLVLDFRDSWSVNHGYDGRRATAWRGKIKERIFSWLEVRSIRNSSAVVFANSMLKDDYGALYETERDKFKVIDNGYDPEDFLAVKPCKVAEKKSIILTGKLLLYTPEILDYILSALEKLKDLTFIYVGGECEEVQRIASKSSVSEQVIVYPYVPYSEMLDLIAGADYALMTNGMIYGVGTKIFEYLALGKSTICFVPNGSQAVMEFSSQPNVVVLESPHSEEGVLAGLRRLMSLSTASDGSAVEHYSRKLATEKLAELFSHVEK